jgi:hypothetical protein
MTLEQRLLDDIRAEIAKLPKKRRERILFLKIQFDNILRAEGHDASLALMLVHAEETVKI